MTAEDQILSRIETLQQTRQYADEIETVRLTGLIDALWAELEELDKGGGAKAE